MFCGDGVRHDKLHDNFRLVTEIGLADVVVVRSFHGESQNHLAARLHGVRLADEEWLVSNMKAGKCLQLHAHILRKTLKFYMSAAFMLENAGYVNLLRSAAKINKKLRQQKKTNCLLYTSPSPRD